MTKNHAATTKRPAFDDVTESSSRTTATATATATTTTTTNHSDSEDQSAQGRSPSDSERENYFRRRYSKDRKVGEGTYAVVYEGRDVQKDRRIAIKRIKMSSQTSGLDISALREIKYLRELRHPNIVELLDVFVLKKTVNLVLDFYEADLEMLIKDPETVFAPSDVKSWMLMLVRGMEYLHQRFILHRDLKPNNLLLSSTGALRIADFGLAREHGFPMLPMTSQVVTRWYRAPELLLGARHYTGAVDVWAAGCIFAELMLRTPFLPADTDMAQLSTIFRALGTPSEADWPDMTKLPDYIPFPKHPKPTLRSIFTAASDDALDLLAKMLVFDPARRITMREALSHPYFINPPYPTVPSDLPKTNAAILAKHKQMHEQKKARIGGLEPKQLFT